MAELKDFINSVNQTRLARIQNFYRRKQPMAGIIAPVEIAMPLDDDLIKAVGQGVQLERVLLIQSLRNQKAEIDALQQILASAKPLAPQAAPSVTPGGATVAVTKQT